MIPDARKAIGALLGTVPDDEIQFLVEGTRPLPVAPSYAVYREGSAPSHLFILLTGRIRLTRQRPDGGQEIVAYVHPVALFGHVGVLGRRPHLMTAAAMEPSTCLALPATLLEYRESGVAARVAVRLRDVALIAMNQQMRAVNARLLSLAGPDEMMEGMADDLGSYSLPSRS